jgi:HlyD family secretion protein
MKPKRLWTLLTLATVAVLGYGLMGWESDSETSYRFVEVELGTVEQVVASTGSMQATETIEVGTQVSGLISEILVDFNDRVEAGQLLARIDPAILQQEVRSAEAGLARSQADLDHAIRTLDRATGLYREQALTTSELESSQYQHDLAAASFEQAQVALDRARQNLAYTEIRAPIDGVVIERAVEVGQTVAASMSAPTLFVLAGDLREMEILASVDESDIGMIHEGQEVRFTVQGYPGEYFQGEVSQVRLQSDVVENVVTYGVVIAADNTDGRLLPGMTATVEFIVARAEDVLRVSNTALRFQPTQAMAEELAMPREGNRGARGQRPEPESASGYRPERAGAKGGLTRERSGDGPTLLFFLDETGALRVARVETGLSDGQRTEVSGLHISEGMQVIAAVTSNATEAATNPFQSRSQPPGRPR